MFFSADDYLANDKINHPLMHRYIILSQKPSSGLMQFELLSDNYEKWELC